MVFIQFYNNPCGVNSFLGSAFNWATWQNWASVTSLNKNVKLYLGVPASSTAASTGFISTISLEAILAVISKTPNFGGVMMWYVRWSTNS